MSTAPARCPHCGEDRQVEPTTRRSIYYLSTPPTPLVIWFCNVCGREFIAAKH
jgi:hypothetical protein